MKKGKENDINSNMIIILLIAIIFILVIGIMILFYKYDKLESRYEKNLESKYYIDDFENDKFDDDDDLNGDLPNDDINDTPNKTTSVTNYISRSKALQIALKDMKLSQSDVYDIDVEFENKTTHGNYVYEVSFDYKNNEYEYFIDAKTGKILSSFQSRD